MQTAKKRTINKLSQLSVVKQYHFFKKIHDQFKLNKIGNIEQLAKLFTITSALTYELLICMKTELECQIEINEEDQTYKYLGGAELNLGYFELEADQC